MDQPEAPAWTDTLVPGQGNSAVGLAISRWWATGQALTTCWLVAMTGFFAYFAAWEALDHGSSADVTGLFALTLASGTMTAFAHRMRGRQKAGLTGFEFNLEEAKEIRSARLALAHGAAPIAPQ